LKGSKVPETKNIARNCEFAIARHLVKTPNGFSQVVEVVHAEWKSGKLILEQWTMTKNFAANNNVKELQNVA
jgi:hypothetical protein